MFVGGWDGDGRDDDLFCESCTVPNTVRET